MKTQLENRELELYVHIPFCVKKCDYCDFLSGPVSVETQEKYVTALEQEMETVKEGVGRNVVSVFIGGGTPSLLSPSHMERILKQLYRKFNITPDAEITMEANPGTLCLEKLETCRRWGVNRLSIGLQSPDDRELKMLGRIHTYREFVESFTIARNAGFDNINVDLMFAIPGQEYEGWIRNLKQTAELGPEHISAYSLIVEPGTPLAQRNLELPSEDTEYRMYEDTGEILGEYGYEQYEISNYARPGFACRHNAGYWKRTDYLGLGLGAASLFDHRRFSNTSDMEEYIKDCTRPEKLRREETMLTREDEMGEFMFLGLRMAEGISKAEFEDIFGCNIEAVYGSVLNKYKNMSLLAEEDNRIFLTRRGIHVSNTIMADFLLP
ncbi:MAG: radical SAM family heme chaperone HemW [Eubacteriales bacterium]|nr:radical SAM family heme chaperone HemW [Eubacteriales bacterium]